MNPVYFETREQAVEAAEWYASRLGASPETRGMWEIIVPEFPAAIVGGYAIHAGPQWDHGHTLCDFVDSGGKLRPIVNLPRKP